MHISTLGIVLLVLLICNPAALDALLNSALRGALWLAGVIAAGVVLWFSGKFLYAYPSLAIFLGTTLIGGLLVLLVAFFGHLKSLPRSLYRSRAEYLAANPPVVEGYAAEQRDTRIKNWLAYKPYSGPGHLFPCLSDEHRIAVGDWAALPASEKLRFVPASLPSPVYRDADFEAGRLASQKSA